MRNLKTWTLSLVIVALLAAFATVLPSTAEEADGQGAASAGADKEKPALDGAKVFGWYCGACHSERYSKERTDAEWDVIVTHMRVRSQLTGEQADAVLRYLKENNE